MDKSDISASRDRRRPLRSAFAALAIVAAALTFAPAVLSPAEAAGHHTSRAAHVTTKSARFVSDLGGVQQALNQCRGPVAWNSRGEGAPWLMFEHDYCGGAWALSARAGHRLRIRNGPLAGIWRANGRTRVVSRGALVATTQGLGYLVVQTCIPGTSRMRLVGFDRVG